MTLRDSVFRTVHCKLRFVGSAELKRLVGPGVGDHKMGKALPEQSPERAGGHASAKKAGLPDTCPSNTQPLPRAYGRSGVTGGRRRNEPKFGL